MGSPVNLIGTNSENFAQNSGMLYAQRNSGTLAQTGLDLTLRAVDRWLYRFEASAGSATAYTLRNQILSNIIPNLKTRGCFEAGLTAGAASSVVQNHARQIFEKSHARRLLTAASGQFTVGFWYRTNRAGVHAVLADVYNSGAGFNAVTNAITIPFTVVTTNVWTYYTVTFNFSLLSDTGASEYGAGLLLNIGPRSGGTGIATWNANDYFNLGQVQINPGAVAASWCLAGGNDLGELLICQRYFEKSYHVDTNPGTADGSGVVLFYPGNASFSWQNTQACGPSFRFISKKRIVPNVVIYAEGGTPNAVAPNRSGALSAASVLNGTDAFSILQNTGGTQTVNFGYTCHFTADADL